MIQTIEIDRVLPEVFVGMEQTDAIRRSRVWLAERLTFDKGCRVCVRAESGGGKSSLLSFIYGNRRDYRGRILFDGRNVRELGVKEWCDVRMCSLALLPQEMRLFPELTVEENIGLKNSLTGHFTESHIRELLGWLGIEEKFKAKAGKLSIGQQQRVAVVRSLCQPFDFILLDEPVSHLDERNNRLVAEMVAEEASRQGAGVISTSVGNHLLLEGAQFIDL